MTYLSTLDDCQTELIGGGFAYTPFGGGDTTTIVGISLNLLKQSYDVKQVNKVTNYVVTAPSLFGAPLNAASIWNNVGNTSLIG
jgi:hypothetical protein